MTEIKKKEVWQNATLEQRLDLLFTIWKEHAILVDARLDAIEKKLKELEGEQTNEHTVDSEHPYLHT